MSLQTEQRLIERQDQFLNKLDDYRRYAELPPAKPMATAKPEFTPPELPPFTMYVEQNCEDCGGSGRDIGSPDPWDGDICSHCNGSGKETVLRQFLAEAFAIAGNRSSIQPEKAHLVALTEYARQTVNVLFNREAA